MLTSNYPQTTISCWVYYTCWKVTILEQQLVVNYIIHVDTSNYPQTAISC